MKYKYLEATNFKFDEANRTFEGYASAFNGVDSFGDTVLPGAYKETLKSRERPVRMRWNHFGPVVGKWIELKEDETGLFAKGQLTEGHSVAEDVYASLKHGAVDGLSIGYRVVKSESNDHGGEDLHEIELIEISVVEEPADLGAMVNGVKDAREAICEIESIRDAESFLRDAWGIPKATAKALVSQVKAVVQRDAVPEPEQRDAAESRLNWRLFRTLKLQH